MPLPCFAPPGSVRPVGLAPVSGEDRLVLSPDGGSGGRPDGGRVVGDGSHGTVRLARFR